MVPNRSEYDVFYLRLFLANANSVGDSFEILILSSKDDDWDPWLDSEFLFGRGGNIALWVIRWEMLLLLSGWGTFKGGKCCDIGSNDGGGKGKIVLV